MPNMTPPVVINPREASLEGGRDFKVLLSREKVMTKRIRNFLKDTNDYNGITVMQKEESMLVVHMTME